MSNVQNAVAERKSQGSAPSPYDTIKATLDKNRVAVKEALPDMVGLDRFIRIVLTQVRTNPKLLQCSAESLVAGTLQAAQLGLEPGLLGQCWLVPYWDHKSQRFHAQFQMGYKGTLMLVHRASELQTITAQAVHANDQFDVAFGSGGHLTHKPFFGGDRGQPIAYYAYATMKNGGEMWWVMTRADVESHRDRYTKSKDRTGQVYGPWVDNFDSMARKTVLIQLMKYLPVSVEVQRQIAADNTVKLKIDKDMLDVVDTVATEIPDLELGDGQAPAAVLTPPSAEPANPPAASVASPSAGDNTPSEQFLALTGAGYPREAAEKIVGLIGKNVPLAKWSPFQREAFALVVSAVVNSLQRGMEMDEIQDALHSCIKSPKSWNKGAVEELRRALGAVFVLVEGGAADEPTDADLPV